MRKSLTLSLVIALGLAGSAMAQSANQPQKLTPMAPTPAPKPTFAPPPAATPAAAPARTPAPAPTAAAAAPTPATTTPNAQQPAEATVAPPAPSAPTCLPEIAKAEKRYHIPDGLLVSIALVESGHRDPDTGILEPWPWTIDSHGQGQYFDTEDAAANAAATLLARNDSLVDVGCMQVDLYHHPHAFQTLLAAFDPETNVDYAARFLVELKDKNGSWSAAVAAYHAGEPALGGEYVARVLYYWKDLGTTMASARVIGEKPDRRGFIIDTQPQPLEIAEGFLEKRDYPAALAIYRSLLASVPDDQSAMLGLARTMHATGQNDEARQHLERLLTENPSNLGGLALLLAIVDDMAPPQRLTALLSARQVVPLAPQIPARIAVIEDGRGHKAEAVAQMGEAVRLAPTDAVFRLDYATLLDKAGYRAASAAAYTQFLELYRPGSVALTVPLDQIRQRLYYLQAQAP